MESMNHVLVLIAHGTEEMEAVITIDILRRAGLSVIVAGDNEIVTCSRGVRIIPDTQIEKLRDTETFEMIVIPGGAEGVQNLIAEPHVERLLTAHLERQGIIAALCAAPTLLAELHLLPEDIAITSHPSVQHLLDEYTYLEDAVVIDGNFITSRAAGTAFEFALALVEILTNAEKSERISRDILFNHPANE